MALSNDDWNRMDRMRKEDRDHLDAITEKLDSDSIRQWKELQRINTELQVHKTESAGVHRQPCPTAAALMSGHVKESITHNPKAAIPLLASLLGLASTVGAWLAKVLHVKSEVKP